MNDIIAIIVVALCSETLIRELPDYLEPDYMKNWAKPFSNEEQP